LRDFREHGQKAIATVRRTQPAAYLKICALLVPKEMKPEHTGGVKAMTDEELEEAIAILRGMMATGGGAKVIETVALPGPAVVPDDNPERPNQLMAAADNTVRPMERKRKVSSPSGA
jgi:hypothetical protein